MLGWFMAGDLYILIYQATTQAVFYHILNWVDGYQEVSQETNSSLITFISWGRKYLTMKKSSFFFNSHNIQEKEMIIDLKKNWRKLLLLWCCLKRRNCTRLLFVLENSGYREKYGNVH